MKSFGLRREEAAKRKAAWDKLTPTEKLRELGNRPGQCARQIARIGRASK